MRCIHATFLLEFERVFRSFSPLQFHAFLRGESNVIGWIGQKTIDGYMYLTDLAAQVYLTARELVSPGRQGRWASLRVTLRQLLFTGVDALPVVSAIALMLGLLVILQAGTQLPKVGGEGLIGTIIVVVIIRELGPLTTAILVIGRSGAAITTELGNMRVAQEITALELMGIRTSRYIVMPRVVAVVVSMLCLIFYFDAIAVLGGFIVARIKLTIPFYPFADAVAQALSLADVLGTVVKGVLFGTTVAVVCCHHGLSVRSSYTEVPQQVTRAMINSITICLLVDILVTVAAYF
jgi:phospholipid/cholesterol/gamma-HCH transport system permease protein